MTTSQADLLRLAKQGDTQAITALINSHLQPKGISVKIVVRETCLQVMLESTEIPEKDSLTSFIQKGVAGLKIPFLETLRIYGKQIGANSPAWTVDIKLKKNTTSHPPQALGAQQTQPIAASSLSPRSTQQNTSSHNSRVESGHKSSHSNGLVPQAEMSRRSQTRGHCKQQTPQKDIGFELLGNINSWLSYHAQNWTIKKTAWSLIGVGLFCIALTYIAILNDSNSSMYSAFLGLSLGATGFFILSQEDSKKKNKNAVEEVYKYVEKGLEEYQDKFPDVTLVESGNFGQTDNVSFAVSGVSYERKIVAYYEEESLGVVVVDTDWGAFGQSIKGRKPIPVGITGKGIIVELVIHNYHKSTITFDRRDIYLIDQNFNRYSVHEESNAVSMLRGGVATSMNLRPGVQARYFIVFDVNLDAAGIILELPVGNSSGRHTCFSLDLIPNVVM